MQQENTVTGGYLKLHNPSILVVHHQLETKRGSKLLDNFLQYFLLYLSEQKIAAHDYIVCGTMHHAKCRAPDINHIYILLSLSRTDQPVP